MKQKLIRYSFLASIFVGILFIANGLIIPAKAYVAQYLIEDAWDESIKSQKPQKPWSWADTKTIMKMYVPSLDKEIYVLEGDAGASLAFAPGHSSDSFLPNENGTVMISAHRDTHFSFLKQLKQGDEVILQDCENNFHIYKMNASSIIDANKQSIPIYSGMNELVLVTCYPFDAIQAGGSKRYVAKFSYI